MKAGLTQILLGLSLFLNHLAIAEDMNNGQSIHEKKCEGCHARKSPFGNSDWLYKRSDGKVKTMENLRSMVAVCNSNLRLDLFPDEEEDIVIYLKEHFYHLK